MKKRRTHRLTKLSDPGWEKDFPAEKYLKACLYEYICEGCRGDDSVDQKSTLRAMLSTACGCEFMVETIYVSQP